MIKKYLILIMFFPLFVSGQNNVNIIGPDIGGGESSALLDSTQTRWDMDADTVSQITKHVKVKTLGSDWHQITYAASIVFDGDNGMNQYCNATGNITTMTFTNMKQGPPYVFEIWQDATGSRTLSEANFGTKAVESADITTTAYYMAKYVIHVEHDNTKTYSISNYDFTP